MRTCCKRFEYIGLGKNKQVNHWENAAHSRCYFNFDLNVARVITPEMAGVGEIAEQISCAFCHYSRLQSSKQMENTKQVGSRN